MTIQNCKNKWLKTSSLPILITKHTSSWRWNQCIFASLLPWRSLIPRLFLPWDPNCKVQTRSNASTLTKSYSWTNYLDITYLPNLQPVKYECITFWTQHYAFILALLLMCTFQSHLIDMLANWQVWSHFWAWQLFKKMEDISKNFTIHFTIIN
jgi:hypothetical protein